MLNTFEETFEVTEMRTFKHEPFFIVGGGGGGAYSWYFTVYHHNFHTLQNASQSLELIIQVINHSQHGHTGGACFTASLGDITIQKVVETPGTMLGAVQLRIHKSFQLST